MKIAHVIESSGGSADFVLYLVKYLPHHEHIIVYSDRTFAGRFDTVKTTYPQVTFLHWKFAQREIRIVKDIRALFSLLFLVRKMKADVIHLHSSKAGFLGRIAGFLLRKKNMIYTPNGLAFLRKDVSASKMRVYAWLEYIAHKLCGKVICCSVSEANALIERGINCTAISNGTVIFDPPSKVKTSGPLTIATTGRVTNQKNPGLFNQIAGYFEKDNNYKFIWIGGGELEHELTASSITITGWVNHAAVIDHLESVDVYISTALWEGLPFAVLEAMNMKKPLLLSRCVGNVDLVKENYNGFLFNTAEDAIEKIQYFYQQKETILSTFGNNSYTFVKTEFNVEVMAQKYEAAYLSIQP